MPHHVKILEMTLKFQESEAACSLGRMQCYSFGLLNLTYLTILQRTTKPCSKHSGPYIRLMYWRGSCFKFEKTYILNRMLLLKPYILCI